MRLEHSLPPHTKVNSRSIKDLYVRPDAMKLLQEKIGRKCLDINRSNILFLDPSPGVMEIKTKISQWA